MHVPLSDHKKYTVIYDNIKSFTAALKSTGLFACTQCSALVIFIILEFGNCCLISNSS